MSTAKVTEQTATNVTKVEEEIPGSVSVTPIPAAGDSSSITDTSDLSKGWLMVGLVFVANFLVFGFFKSLGMLTKILNHEFVYSTMNVYILMCITYSLNCAAGPLSCYLTRRYSARTMALVGTSMVTVGLMLSWFAKSLLFLYFSIGILTGVGSGLTYPTGIILVSNYFIGTRNAAIANALVVSGSPIGGMVMPFIISLLSDLYTSRGAFLIIGALMLHAVLCAKAFSPPVVYEPPSDLSLTPVSAGTAVTSFDTSMYTSRTGSSSRTTGGDKGLAGPTGVLRSSDPGGKGPSTATSAISIRDKPISRSQLPSTYPLMGTGEGGSNGNNNSPEKLSEENLIRLTNRRIGTTNLLESAAALANKNKLQAEVLPATGSQPYVLALDQSCVVLCPSISDMILKQRHDRFFESSNSLVEGDSGKVHSKNGDANKDVPSGRLPPGMDPYTCLSPLKEPLYVFLLFSNTATAMATANIYLMVSQLVDVYDDDNDYTKTSLVYLIISSSDLMGRIVGAYLCDKKFTSPPVIYAIGLLSAGASSACLVSLNNLVQMCFGVFVYGFSSGLHVGIYGLLLTNIVGISRIHAGYGISMLVNGSVQCIAILLSGGTISKYSSCFSWLVPALGGILVCGGVLWIFGLFLVKLIKKNKAGLP